MIYGFNEKGFSPHRFVFNALQEPIDILKHDELYAINFGEHRIIFYEDMDLFKTVAVIEYINACDKIIGQSSQDDHWVYRV